MRIFFTDFWVDGFGWEDCIYLPEDFHSVEVLGKNDTDGVVFLGINDIGKKHILKGYYG